MNKRGRVQISGNAEQKREQKREKRLKTNEESLRELWDNVKCTNICIIGVPEGEQRERKGTE